MSNFQDSYKVDLHIHTKESSPCGRISAQDIVTLYLQQGYRGIAITDHFHEVAFGSYGLSNWSEKVDRFLEGYLLAKKFGDKSNLDVYFGLEFRNPFSDNDFLIYGLNVNILYEHENLYLLPLDNAVKIFKDAGAMVFQAHPMRLGKSTLADPSLLDGIEVFNGNSCWPYDENAAIEAARCHHLIGISGSDCHISEDLANGGMSFSFRPDTFSDLLLALYHEERFKLIKNSFVRNPENCFK